MVLKKLDTLNLMSLYKKQEAALNLSLNLEIGQKLNNPLFFLFPFTTENGDNIYEDGYLHISFVKVTNDINIVNPCIYQGLLKISGNDKGLSIHNLKLISAISIDDFKGIVKSMYTTLHEFILMSSQQHLDIIKVLAANPVMLKDSILEYYELSTSNTSPNFWELKNINITDRTSHPVQPYVLENNFYISSKTCPICSTTMFKTVFPVDGEYPIQSNTGAIALKRVFTCNKCLNFYTAPIGKGISCGTVFVNSCKTLSQYKFELQSMDSCGTTNGRSDL